MTEAHIFKTPAGEEMVILSKADYDALIAAAADAEENAADATTYAERKAALRPEDLLPPEVSARITKGDTILRAVRKWRDMTQADLARRTGFAQGHISDMEGRRRGISIEAAKRLATALDVPADWLT